MGTQLRSTSVCTFPLTHSLATTRALLLNNSLTARRGHSLTLTSHRFDSELNQLAAKMDGKGGKEGEDTPALRQIVQAHLPLISARTPHLYMY